MDDTKLNKLIEHQLLIVPQDVRTLVVSPEFETKINWTAAKFNLSKDQKDALWQETFFVLIGLAHLMDYTDNLIRELALPKDRARLVAQEVGSQIFAGVKESLREIGIIIEAERKQQGNPTVPQPSQTPRPPQPQTQKTAPPPINIPTSTPPVRPTTEASTPTPAPTPTSSGPKPVAGVLIEQLSKEPKEPVEKINKAVLLSEIEHPALLAAHAAENVKVGAGTIIDQKLAGMVKTSREEVKIDMTKIPPGPQYKGPDPYREPLQ